jgi:hypothetical protein
MYILTPEYIENGTKPRAVAKKEYIQGPGRRPDLLPKFVVVSGTEYSLKQNYLCV